MTTMLRALLEAAQGLTEQEKLLLIHRLSASLLQQREAAGDGSPASDFWHPRPLDVLIAEQERVPVTDLSELAAAWWPGEETADDLIASVRQQRDDDRLRD